MTPLGWLGRKTSTQNKQTMKLCSQSEGTLPSRMIAAAMSWIMEALVSLAARIISTTMPDGPFVQFYVGPQGGGICVLWTHFKFVILFLFCFFCCFFFSEKMRLFIWIVCYTDLHEIWSLLSLKKKMTTITTTTKKHIHIQNTNKIRMLLAVVVMHREAYSASYVILMHSKLW